MRCSVFCYHILGLSLDLFSAVGYWDFVNLLTCYSRILNPFLDIFGYILCSGVWGLNNIFAWERKSTWDNMTVKLAKVFYIFPTRKLCICIFFRFKFYILKRVPILKFYFFDFSQWVLLLSFNYYPFYLIISSFGRDFVILLLLLFSYIIVITYKQLQKYS